MQNVEERRKREKGKRKNWIRWREEVFMAWVIRNEELGTNDRWF
jgi:hypothetical protein